MRFDATPTPLLTMMAPGAEVTVRDEEWLVTAVSPTRADGLRVNVIVTSDLVKDTTATFLLNSIVSAR